MANLELVKMLYGRYDFPHVIGSTRLTKSFTLNNFVKKFTTCRQFHNYVDVSEIDISLVELDNVWVVETPQNLKFLLKRLDIFLNVRSQDTLYSVRHFGIGDAVSQAHSSEVSTADKSFKFVYFANVKIRILLLDIFEGLLTWTRTTDSHRI